MSRVLYRKYRPRSLSDVAGQSHITKTLSNSLNNKKIAHAYLFTGPKGVGKTSVARILAHEVNSLPYDDDSPHIDIIEIDAASNRRIDEIRELRELVYIAPVQAKYKVYIIDEVHMLTKEAFNALLKTLEEPPQHVIFILATTDAHKLPETIVSRTQRFGFKPIPINDLIKSIKDISHIEKIKIDNEALELIAQHSQGSLRDAISLLDQARSTSSTITANGVAELLGLPPDELINKLIKEIISNGSKSEISSILSRLYTHGYQASQIASDLFYKLKNLVLVENNSSIVVFNLLTKLIETPASYDPEKYLEIILLDSINIEVLPKSELIVEKKNIEHNNLKDTKTKDIKIAKISKTELWPNIISLLKSKHNTLYGIVRIGQPEFSDNDLIINFKFDFHVKRLKEANNSKVLKSIVDEVCGHPVNIVIKQNSNIVQSEQSSSVKENKAIDNISAIFNGAELLES